MTAEAQIAQVVAHGDRSIFDEAVDLAALMLWYEALLSLMVGYYTQLHILEHGEDSDPKLRQLRVMTEDHVLMAGRFHIMQAGKLAYVCESAGLEGPAHSDLMERVMEVARERAERNNEPTLQEITDFWDAAGAPWPPANSFPAIRALQLH
jgi:hypothetical protein